MQRDHAWHSARHLEDLDSAADIGRLAGERAVARLDADAAQARQISGAVRSARSSTLLGHFSGAISGSSIARKTSFLQDKLGSRVFGPGVTHHRRSAAAARAALAAVRCGRRARVAAGAGRRTACSTAGSPRALRRGSSASRRPAMPRAAPAARPAQAPSNLYMAAGSAAARSCSRLFPKRCWSSS